MSGRDWKRVVFAADCDDDSNCPKCRVDYAECACPGPTQDEMEYREVRGVLYARPIKQKKSNRNNSPT